MFLKKGRIVPSNSCFLFLLGSFILEILFFCYLSSLVIMNTQERDEDREEKTRRFGDKLNVRVFLISIVTNIVTDCISTKWFSKMFQPPDKICERPCYE